MRPKGNYNLLEKRRNTAIYLKARGLSVARISKRMKINRSSVYRWNKLFKAEGHRGLRPKLIPGRPGKLTAVQIKKLSHALEKINEKRKYSDKHLSISMVRELIRKKFKTNYNVDHAWRIMKKMNWQYSPAYLPESLRKKGVKLYPHHRGKWKKKRW